MSNLIICWTHSNSTSSPIGSLALCARLANPIGWAHMTYTSDRIIAYVWNLPCHLVPDKWLLWMSCKTIRQGLLQSWPTLRVFGGAADRHDHRPCRPYLTDSTSSWHRHLSCRHVRRAGIIKQTTHFGCHEKHFFVNETGIGQNCCECYARKYIGIVTLAWIKCLIVVDNRLEWTATWEQASSVCVHISLFSRAFGFTCWITIWTNRK